jgi:hypothetical protein
MPSSQATFHRLSQFGPTWGPPTRFLVGIPRKRIRRQRLIPGLTGIQAAERSMLKMSNHDMTNLRSGAAAVCPACREESLAKRTKRMEGWTCVGEYFACALCGAHWADVEPDKGTSHEKRGSERLEALAGLLGESVPEAPKPLTPGCVTFCKDCLHFMRHPFRDRCLLHGRDTGSMDDCASFERRPVDQNTGEEEKS